MSLQGNTCQITNNRHTPEKIIVLVRLTRLSSAVIVAVEHISFCQMNHKYIR